MEQHDYQVDGRSLTGEVMGKRGCAPKPLSERFLNKVKRGSGCWEWQGCKTAMGYGQIRVGGRGTGKWAMYTHRIAWALTHGPIIDNPSCDTQEVLHHCVNPDHLFLGTKSDNSKDSYAKGRHPWRAIHLQGMHPRWMQEALRG